MLWTAFLVLLIILLMGFSIQAGWLLIDMFLVVAFGGAGHGPIERAPKGELGAKVFHTPEAA